MWTPFCARTELMATDTIKGSDWLGDQDAIQYMCREAPATVIGACSLVAVPQWRRNST